MAFQKQNDIIRIINQQKEKIKNGFVIYDVSDDSEPEPPEAKPQIKCSCGKMIFSYPCNFCGLEEPEIIPENHWKCMGCGKYIPSEQKKCECGYSK